MEIYRAESLAVLLRTFEGEGQHFLAVTAAAAFRLDETASLLPAEEALALAAEERPAGNVLDLGLPKLGAEALVAATCYPPSGEPAPVADARFRVGPVRKHLRVHGARTWQGEAVIGEATPFTALPLTWEHAFGGPDVPENPRGMGAVPETLEDGTERHPLPPVEMPDAPMRTSADRPAPAGIGPLPPEAPARRAGLEDRPVHWYARRPLAFPPGFDWSVLALAPSDQRLDEFFRGDEAIETETLHPRQPVQQARLPGLRVRLFARQMQDGEATYQELATQLDTVWLFPEREAGICLWRGLLPVSSADATDIRQVLAVTESLADDPAPAAAYLQSLEETPADESRGEEVEWGDPAGLESPAGICLAFGLVPPPPETVAEEQEAAEAGELPEVAAIEAEYAAKARELGIDPGPMPEPEMVPEPDIPRTATEGINVFRRNGLNLPETEKQLLEMEKETKIAEAQVKAMMGFLLGG